MLAECVNRKSAQQVFSKRSSVRTFQAQRTCWGKSQVAQSIEKSHRRSEQIDSEERRGQTTGDPPGGVALPRRPRLRRPAINGDGKPLYHKNITKKQKKTPPCSSPMPTKKRHAQHNYGLFHRRETQQNSQVMTSDIVRSCGVRYCPQ